MPSPGTTGAKTTRTWRARSAAATTWANSELFRFCRTALLIEARAKARLADEYDAAQERGEVAGRDRTCVGADNAPPTAADLGLRRDQIHEARQIRRVEETEFLPRTQKEVYLMARSRTALLLAIAATISWASDPSAEDARSAFIGPWALSKWTVTGEDGSVTYPYGPNAEGLLIYTDDGQMAVQLSNPDVPIDGSGSIDQSYFAYFGTYSVDEEQGTITHNIERSLASSWVDTEQIRSYEFLPESQLNLIAVVPTDNVMAAEAGASGSNVLEWVRPD